MDQQTLLQPSVYVEGFTDPVDWKQYDGEYTLTLYYFDEHTHPTGDLGIAASYVTTAGTYTFDPPHYGEDQSRHDKTPMHRLYLYPVQQLDH